MKILCPEKIICDLLESYHFVKLEWSDKEKSPAKIKFIKYIIFLHFKFFSWKIIFPFSN